jgi:hypothetical protein
LSRSIRWRICPRHCFNSPLSAAVGE